MSSQRGLQLAARRLAIKPTSFAASRFSAPAASLLQVRNASINSSQAKQMPQDDAMHILVAQRLSRPVAPHLSIYKPQITWIGSSLNRITGVALSGALYVFGVAYLAAPVLGWQITSAGLAAGFAKWPLVAKIGAKMFAALPFTYHSFNGLRHLVWDMGSQLTNQQVIRTGWTVVGLSIVSALGLALFV